MEFFPIPTEIFTFLCMDFLELETCKGIDDKSYGNVLVIVCRLSGYILATPCQNAGWQPRVLHISFWKNVFALWVCPMKLLVIKIIWCLAIFQTLCGLLGIRLRWNGRAEVAFKAVVNTLRISLAEHKKAWSSVLPWAIFQINNLPGVVLPHSPFKFVFGRDPPAIRDIPPRPTNQK